MLTVWRIRNFTKIYISHIKILECSRSVDCKEKTSDLSLIISIVQFIEFDNTRFPNKTGKIVLLMK